MTSTSNSSSCVPSNDGSGCALTPATPYYALRYQFGMLLGVEDFEAEQSYLRGKSRLHNAWLHREGVVWGLDVQIDTAHNEVKVMPGLALDGSGHELHLDATACLDIGQWFASHSKDAGFTPVATATGVQFDAHVTIAFDACLTRQVPAMSEPCQNGNSDKAYSRIFETAKLSLLPGLAPQPTWPYHRLRLLFGLTSAANPPTAAEQDVLDAIANIATHRASEQPAQYLQALRNFAALDVIDLQPAASPDGSGLTLFPAPDCTPVVLANLQGLTLDDNAGTYVFTGGTVSRGMRPSHIATSTIQELLCGPLFQEKPAAPAQKGPRVVPASVALSGSNLGMDLDSDANPATIQPGAFELAALGSGGWTNIAVDTAVWTAASKHITLTLAEVPSAATVRLLVKGTGLTPVLGTNGIALGGTSSSPDGQDFVWMKEVS
jgi:hypothetical protein